MSRRIFKSFDQNHGLTFWKILSLRRFYSRDSLLFPIYLPLSYKNRCFFSFFLFFGRGGGAGGSCFVVRDLFRSGCRGNYYLTPPPSPLPNVRLFSSLPTILYLTDSYLKLVRAYDITARVNDLIDADILMINVLPFFFANVVRENGSTQLKTYSLVTRHSLHTLLHGSIIR